TGDDAVHGLFELVHRDDLLVPPRREDGRLVYQVRKVRAAEAGRRLRERTHGDVVCDGLALRVDGEDSFAALHVRGVQDDLAVEAVLTQERGVEDVVAV